MHIYMYSKRMIHARGAPVWGGAYMYILVPCFTVKWLSTPATGAVFSSDTGALFSAPLNGNSFGGVQAGWNKLNSCVWGCLIFKPRQQPSHVSVRGLSSNHSNNRLTDIVCVCGCHILNPQRQPSRVFVCVLSSNHSSSRLSDIVCV